MQYIGARYVPKWYVNSVDDTSNWEVNVEYEPLTWVTTPNNHLYLSKKTVPDNIGSPAQNTLYWLDMGLMTGNIQQLQQDVAQLILDMDAAEDDIDDLDTRVTALETSNPSRRIVCVTDSYGTHSATNWAARTFSNLGISDANDHFLFAEGSSGFSHQGQSGHTFEELLTYNIASVTDASTITDVIFGGGTNDFYYYVDKATLWNAIESAVTYAKGQFPNAKIWIAFMGYFVAMDTAMREDYYNTISCYQSQALTLNCGFINAYAPMHSYFYRSDSMHPNEYGNQAIAEIVTATLRGCNSPIPMTSEVYGLNKFNSTITPDAATTATSGTLALSMAIKGDSAILHINTMGLVRNVDFNPSQNIIIGTYNTNNIPIISPNDFEMSIPVLIKVGSTNSVEMVRLTLAATSTVGEGYILIRPYYSILGITFIQFQEMDITIPLICA